jgi:hypothetical protein
VTHLVKITLHHVRHEPGTLGPDTVAEIAMEDCARLVEGAKRHQAEMADAGTGVCPTAHHFASDCDDNAECADCGEPVSHPSHDTASDEAVCPGCGFPRGTNACPLCVMNTELSTLRADLAQALRERDESRKGPSPWDQADCFRAQQFMAGKEWARPGHTYLSQALDRIVQLDADLAKAVGERDLYATAKDTNRDELEKMAIERDQLRADLAKAQAERDENAKMRGYWAQQDAGNCAKVMSLEQERDQLRADLAKAVGERDEAHKFNKLLAHNIARAEKAEADLAAASQERNGLISKLAIEEGFRAEDRQTIDFLKADLAAMRDRAEEAEADVVTYKDSIRMMNKEFGSMRDLAGEYRAACDRHVEQALALTHERDAATARAGVLEGLLRDTKALVDTLMDEDGDVANGPMVTESYVPLFNRIKDALAGKGGI